MNRYFIICVSRFAGALWTVLTGTMATRWVLWFNDSSWWQIFIEDDPEDNDHDDEPDDDDDESDDEPDADLADHELNGWKGS